jgi:hypothetical protein
VNAEIAARLLLEDFPDHAGVVLLLQEVLAQARKAELA